MIRIPRLENPKQIIRRVESAATEMRQRSDRELADEAKSLRFRAMSGERRQDLLPRAFALVREASGRVLGKRHYEVQLLGGIHASRRTVIEMETGEGKTLTATLPLFLYALEGKGAHLATANDYLAERDAAFVRPLFELLGMTVGVIKSDIEEDERRAAYQCDITYGTSSEFGFDFLRDRMLARERTSREPLTRDLHFVLVDEADSLLIDEAGTPLIIGAEAPNKDEKQRAYSWAAAVAPTAILGRHFRYDQRDKKVELTRAGRSWCRWSSRDFRLARNSAIELYEMLERAIKVNRDYKLDRNYVIRDGEVIIVNEHTGRLGEGRQWQDGIHQAIQAHEQLEITVPSSHAARITIQGLFLSYRHLGGMTGTAASATKELKKVYKLSVVRIPTHRPSQRVALSTRFFADEQSKWASVCEEIQQVRQTGRPVLVGTRSVRKSERLSTTLMAAGIEHQVLNARCVAAEADIVATAGKAGAVTIATNMAGRGTDIELTDAVREQGGLHVILTELHDSPRIDRQLFGRCGRQGDPGTTRQFMCAADAVLKTGFGNSTAKDLRETAAQAGEPCSADLFGRAQQLVEQRNRRDRMSMLYHEKRKLRSIWQLGLDPLLDTTG